MQAPSPNKFENTALIAMPLAIASGGLVRFGLLNAGQGFPLLAIAMAPPIFIACFSQPASANRLDWQPSPDFLSHNAGAHESAIIRSQ
jgi:hypothetical protein